MGEQAGNGTRSLLNWGFGPALPLASCVTLGKSLHPVLPHLQNARPERNYPQGPFQHSLAMAL